MIEPYSWLFLEAMTSEPRMVGSADNSPGWSLAVFNQVCDLLMCPGIVLLLHVGSTALRDFWTMGCYMSTSICTVWRRYGVKYCRKTKMFMRQFNQQAHYLLWFLKEDQDQNSLSCRLKPIQLRAWNYLWSGFRTRCQNVTKFFPKYTDHIA